MRDIRSYPYYIESRGVPLKVLRTNGRVRLTRLYGESGDYKALKGIHSHFTYEIFFVTEGTLELVTEEQTFIYERKVVIIPPHFNHYSFPHGDGSFCLLFTMEGKGGDEKIFREIEGILNQGISELPLTEDTIFYIRKMDEKSKECTEAAQKDAQLLATLIFNEIMQYLISPKSVRRKSTESDSKHIYVIEQYINAHVNEKIYLYDIAGHIHLSARQVSRIIHQECGCTLADLVKEKKLAIAKILLKNTDMKVSEIATQVNVGTENYFYMLFSQKYGLSPLQYRKKKRGLE